MVRYRTPLLLLLGAVLCSAAPLISEDTFTHMFDSSEVLPPHCTKTPIVLAQTSQNANTAVARAMQMQFYIGLHTTVCFRLAEGEDGDNSTQSSWLHTVRLDKLEHHHPVTQKYIFAVPEVAAECKCECDATSEVCSAETYKYSQCPADPNQPSSSCYRTFFPNQPSTGCAPGSQPKLCCALRFKPYKDRSYMAVKLEQPTTFATFVYTAYDFRQGKWLQMDRSVSRTQLDGGTQNRFVDSLKRLELSVSAGGRASHQLESGMYFAAANPGGEMDELRRQPLNEQAENNFERLGWYRQDEHGHFHVNNGVVRLDKIHNAKSTNCREQSYRSYLDANHYMPGNFNLSRPLQSQLTWVKSARLYDGTARHAVVQHEEGTNLHITLQVSGDVDGQRLQFFHNASQLGDFDGTIIVDSRSNRFFNLTVFNASGKINGVVKYSTQRDSDELQAFTTYVHDLQPSNRSMLVPLSAFVDAGRRMVCLYADETSEQHAICKVVEYHESPLELDMDTSEWHEAIGHCPECNQININGIVHYLNPMKWLSGVSSIGEFVMMATDVLVYICTLIVVYIILTKIVIPICRCWLCPMATITSHFKNDKKTRKREEERIRRLEEIEDRLDRKERREREREERRREVEEQEKERSREKNIAHVQVV